VSGVKASRLALSPRLSIIDEGGDRFEMETGLHRRMSAPRADRALLEAFSSPRSIEEAHAVIGGSLERLAASASRYLDLGVLVSDAVEEVPDLRALLREDPFRDQALYARIKEEMRAGHVCILRNAFRDDFAERMWRALDSFEQWDAFSGFHNPYFSSQGLGIFDRAKFPSELLECERVFAAPGTRALLADLAGYPCDGDLLFDPTSYRPGDFVGPHSDVNEGRAATFIWQLTKDWRPEWGGHLAWCAPPVNLSPTFNTLILFRVTAAGYHMVTPVSPEARGKRLTLTGWWISREGTPEKREQGDAWYRGPVRRLSDGVFAIG
jgi:hypothetical protein